MWSISWLSQGRADLRILFIVPIFRGAWLAVLRSPIMRIRRAQVSAGQSCCTWWSVLGTYSDSCCQKWSRTDLLPLNDNSKRHTLPGRSDPYSWSSVSFATNTGLEFLGNGTPQLWSDSWKNIISRCPSWGTFAREPAEQLVRERGDRALAYHEIHNKITNNLPEPSKNTWQIHNKLQSYYSASPPHFTLPPITPNSPHLELD